MERLPLLFPPEGGNVHTGIVCRQVRDQWRRGRCFSIQSPESFSTSGNCLVSAAENERGLYLKRTFSLPAGQNLVVTVRGGGSAAGALNGLILSEGGEEDSSSFITIAGNETSPVLLETCRASGTGMHGTNAECSLQVRLPAYEK